MAKGFLITSSKCSYSFKLIITFAFFCSVKEIKTCFLKSFGVIIMSEVFGGMLPQVICYHYNFMMQMLSNYPADQDGITGK